MFEEGKSGFTEVPRRSLQAKVNTQKAVKPLFRSKSNFKLNQNWIVAL